MLLLYSMLYTSQGYAWDKLHQRLWDRGLLHRKDAEVCEAEQERLQRMLTARTSTAARVVVKAEPMRWERLGLLLLGGFAAGYVLRDFSR